MFIDSSFVLPEATGAPGPRQLTAKSGRNELLQLERLAAARDRRAHHPDQRLEVIALEQMRALAQDVRADRVALIARARDDPRERALGALEHPQRAQRLGHHLLVHRGGGGCGYCHARLLLRVRHRRSMLGPVWSSPVKLA